MKNEIKQHSHYKSDAWCHWLSETKVCKIEPSFPVLRHHCVKPGWQTGSKHKSITGVGRRRPLQHGPGLSLPESLCDWLYDCMFDCRSVCLKANGVSVCAVYHLSHLHIYLPDFLSFIAIRHQIVFSRILNFLSSPAHTRVSESTAPYYPS